MEFSYSVMEKNGSGCFKNKIVKDLKTKGNKRCRTKYGTPIKIQAGVTTITASFLDWKLNIVIYFTQIFLLNFAEI
jgi:hypothetical protein